VDINWEENPDFGEKTTNLPYRIAQNYNPKAGDLGRLINFICDLNMLIIML
jgi:hypothetical protein